MKESSKHMIQGAVITVLCFFFFIGVGFIVGFLQKSAKQEMQTSPRLAEVRKIEVVTDENSGERVQTQSNKAPVPITTFCFRHYLYMQVNQGNATWGAPVFSRPTGKPETCNDK